MEYTKQQYIDEILKLREENPDIKLTRNFFRDNSELTEHGIRKLFGTYQQLLIESGLVQDKDSKRLEKYIAKHSNNDQYQELNIEKRSYEGKYLKDYSSDRFKTVIFASDFHDLDSDEFSVNVFLDSIKRIQPDALVFGGDVLDLYDFSNYQKDPRKFNVIGGIKWLHNLLDNIRSFYNGEINFICGNHERRLITYLSNRSPEMMVLLEGIHGFTFSSLLGLDEYEINFISKDSLGVFKEFDAKNELAKNYLIKYGCVAYTHYPNKNYGIHTIYGHHHRFLLDNKYSILNGPYQIIQSGGMCKRHVEYCDNVEHWTNGFIISHIDTKLKLAQHVCIDTTNSIAEVGGKFYYREE